MNYIYEALKEYAWVYGEERPEQAWICTPFDTWERNPHYVGEPQQHPEAYDYDCDYDKSSFDGDA